MAAGKGILQTRGCKPVLLEQAAPRLQGCPQRWWPEGGWRRAGTINTTGRAGLGKALARMARWEQEQSTFMEMPHLKKRLQGMWAKEREHDDFTGQPGPQQLTQGIPREPAGSTVFSAWPRSARGEQRSAFSKPARCPSGRPGPASLSQEGRSADALGELLGPIQIVDIPRWPTRSSSKVSVSDFWNLQMLPQDAALGNASVGAPTLQLKHAMAPMPTAASSSVSWALLPSAFMSLGSATQNWCAKCNLSFRLTSDLVFHMRSHHRKAPAGPDLRSEKLREAVLTCPICCECFREHHHLSRHMASHH